MDYIIVVRGHAIRHNIHCTDPGALVPNVPGNDPEVWIETSAP